MSRLQRFKQYLDANWGAPFIASFMVLLFTATLQLAEGLTDVADNVAAYALYALAIGVALQIVSYVRYDHGVESEVFGPVAPSPLDDWSSKKTLAVIITALVALSAAVVVSVEAPQIEVTAYPPAPLTASITYTTSLGQPDGSAVVSFGVSAAGGALPYQFTAAWSDGVTQNATTGVFSRTIVNQTLPTYANVTVASADGQSVMLVATLESG